MLLLAQEGRIDLDAPVSAYLERWQLPDTAPGFNNDDVTARRLLAHVAGLPFAEYMRRAVFEPVGMAKSTYAPLSTLTDTSGSWTAEGTVAPLYSYAALGATGSCPP